MNPAGTSSWCKVCEVPHTATDLRAGRCTNCGAKVMTTMGNTNWPKATLAVVSRMAMSSVERARGFTGMTPTQRLELARDLDRLTHQTFRIKPKAGETEATFQRRVLAARR